jgi:hypothetical protein
VTWVNRSNVAGLWENSSSLEGDWVGTARSVLRPPQWVGPGKLRPRALGWTPPSNIALSSGVSFVFTANPSFVSGASLLRPPQWVGPGKLRPQRLGYIEVNSRSVALSVTFSLSAQPVVTSVDFPTFVSPSLDAPYNPAQFTVRAGGTVLPGPIALATGVTFAFTANPAFGLTLATGITFGTTFDLGTFIGLDLWTAITQITEAGLTFQINYETSTTTLAGWIVPGTQYPPAGTLVTPGTPGSVVTFTVSTGPPLPLGPTTVPNLVGLPTQQAYDALQAASLSVTNLLWQVSSTPDGIVIAQSIAAGTIVTAGTIVQMTVSTGPSPPPNTVAVPELE